MKYALIIDSVVKGIQFTPKDGYIEVPENVVCGMIRDENNIFKNPAAQIDIPQVVTMRQARLALLKSGILTDVTNAIESGTDEELKIEWEYAMEVRRDWQNLINLATSLGLTDDNLDDLFTLAGTL